MFLANLSDYKKFEAKEKFAVNSAELKEGAVVGKLEVINKGYIEIDILNKFKNEISILF